MWCDVSLLWPHFTTGLAETQQVSSRYVWKAARSNHTSEWSTTRSKGRGHCSVHTPPGSHFPLAEFHLTVGLCMCACWFSLVVSDSVQPYGLWPTRLLCPWDSPGKNNGVGCHALLRGIFLTQESNPHLLWLLPCRQIVYRWATREAPVQIIIFQRVQQGEPKLNTVRVGAGNSTQLSLQFEFNFENFEGHTSFSLQGSPLSSSPKKWVHLNVPYWCLCQLASFWVASYTQNQKPQSTMGAPHQDRNKDNGLP